MAKVPYRSMLMPLLYLVTRTIPDIATGTSMFAKIQNISSPVLCKAINNVIRYIKEMVRHGIRAPKECARTLVVWLDDDCAREQKQKASKVRARPTVRASFGTMGIKNVESCSLFDHGG